MSDLPSDAFVVMLQFEIIVFQRFVVLPILLVHLTTLLRGQMVPRQLIVFQLKIDDPFIQGTFAFFDQG